MLRPASEVLGRLTSGPAALNGPVLGGTFHTWPYEAHPVGVLGTWDHYE